MPADLLTAGMTIIRWGATYLIHSTCLLAGAWTFLRFRRRAGHALRDSLWKTALVGGLATASFQMLLAPPAPFGQLNIAVDAFRPLPAQSVEPLEGRWQPATPADLQTTAADLDVDVSALHEGRSTQTPHPQEFPVAESNAVENAITAGNDFSQPADRASHPTQSSAAWILSDDQVGMAPVIGLLLMTALTAIVIGVARCVWQTAALRRRLAHCSVIEAGRGRRLLDELRRHIPRAPEVLLLSTPDDPEPSAFGVRQWTIVLPERAARDLSDDELRALLAHELAHLVRGDSAWLVISRLVCSCLAFQPLNHLARREWQRAAEFLCDRWAVSRTGSPLALARCLTEVAGWRLSGRTSTALLAATGRKSGLADRIERLVEGTDLAEVATHLHERNHRLAACAIVLCLVTWLAPRVQLLGAREVPSASAISASEAEPDSFRTGEAGAANRGANTTAVAPTEPDDILTEPAQPAASVTTSANEPSHQPAPVELATLLEQLDGELADLEDELAELQGLLIENTSPVVARLAKQLRAEIGRLKQRRAALYSKAKKLTTAASHG